jgi:heme-degrading monooxygenase HmoA
MFIAMNRSALPRDPKRHEQVWLSRDSHLEKVPGFVEFHLAEDHDAEVTALKVPRL